MSQPHIDAMKQALDALNHKKWFRIGSGKPNDPKVEAAITALNAAIEAAEKQEPVAKVRVYMTGGNPGLAWSATAVNAYDSLPPLADGTLLYTAAQAAPEDYTALEQALTRLQKRYFKLHSKVAAQREPDDSLDIDDVAYALEAILQRAGEGATVGHVIALLENLAKPEQEPVAWMRKDGTLRFADGKVFAVGQPFYTYPLAQPEPYRLYVEDFARKCGWEKDSGEGAFEYVHRKLYAQGLEDATPPAQPAPVQEPVLQEIEQYQLQMAGISTAAIGYWKEGDGIHPDYDTPALRDVANLYAKYDALYTAAQRKPLTEERLLEIMRKVDANTKRLPPGVKAFARGVEAAHGITGENT
jgi:hypothetical protein